ncbi:porin [Cupriavidus basilensis]
MKRNISNVAVILASQLALIPATAFAQSNVTLYGIVDQSVRYTTNANAANNGKLELTNGAITNSRWGIRGTEDLGGGLKALFQLENGFDPDTGTANQNGSLFGRKAFVGLSSSVGTLKLGRQNTEGFNFFVEYDPLTIGNYNLNSWPFFLTRIRSNNVASYDARFGALGLGASYGFGETPGSLTSNQYWGGRTTYDFGSVGVGALYQEFRDSSGNRQQMWSLGTKYSVGNAKLFLGYIGGKDRTGAIDNNYMNASSRNIVVSTSAAVANPREDRIGYAGATYRATPALALTGAFYFDSIGNKNGIADNSGKRYTAVALAEYSLSKRTQIYGTVDFNKVSGGATTELPGKSNQLGIAGGVRHIF